MLFNDSNVCMKKSTEKQGRLFIIKEFEMCLPLHVFAHLQSAHLDQEGHWFFSRVTFTIVTLCFMLFFYTRLYSIHFKVTRVAHHKPNRIIDLLRHIHQSV